MPTRPSLRDICCLPGAWIRDFIRRLPEIIWPTAYYSVLVVQVSSDEVDKRSTRVIKKDFKALGCRIERSGALVIV